MFDYEYDNYEYDSTENAIPKDIFDNTYVKMLNATPSSLLPEPPPEPEEETFDGVSKEVLDLQQIERKLNDINTALTNFEVKSNEWHDFLINNKSELAIEGEVFENYEQDEKDTLASINKIKTKLLEIGAELTVLKSTLKQ